MQRIEWNKRQASISLRKQVTAWNFLNSVKKSHFFVLCLTKSDIFEKSKHPKTKIIMTKIVENEIPHLMEMIRFFWEAQFSRYLSLKINIIGASWEKNRWICKFFDTKSIVAKNCLTGRYVRKLPFSEKRSCFYQIRNFILYNFGPHHLCPRTLTFLRNVTFYKEKHKKCNFFF